MSRKRTRGKHWELLPDRPEPAPEPEPTLPPEEQRIRVRAEGRPRGKTATVIAPLVLTTDEREALARRLKRACGCGGKVTEGGIELQGDCAGAARAWLAGRGYGLG